MGVTRGPLAGLQPLRCSNPLLINSSRQIAHSSRSGDQDAAYVCVAGHPAQVRKLSVQRITSPLTYDNLNNIVSGGLYDPALGPVDQNARCVLPAAGPVLNPCSRQ